MMVDQGLGPRIRVWVSLLMGCVRAVGFEDNLVGAGHCGEFVQDCPQAVQRVSTAILGGKGWRACHGFRP